MKSKKIAVVVLDGFGLNPKKEWEIVGAAFNALPQPLQQYLLTLVGGQGGFAKAAIAPISHGVARYLADTGLGTLDELLPKFIAWHAAVLAHPEIPTIDAARMEAATNANYVPWAVNTPYLFSLRQQYPTIQTRTAGVFSGFEEMNPEAMGNSDTGHQQIFNLMVAKQVPTFIADLIRTGAFFKNAELNADLSLAKSGHKVVFKTLLSGEFGDDGYVHSALNHIDAFLKLYFDILELPKSNLQIEAVLDGRDSPYCSSLEFQTQEGIRRYGFLHKLREKLQKYDAVSCVSWILGRQFMDRDYKGGMIKKEYETVVRNSGRRVADFDQALALIASDHAQKIYDPSVEPIIIGNPETVGNNTVFFNAIFRSDRQEPITAALMANIDFVTKQATQKKKLDTWEGFTWITPFPGLISWAMVEYHKDLGDKGLKAVFHDQPHAHNVLFLLSQARPDFRFLFLTEGVKEKHMGLFSRGRRSRPLAPAETQYIVSSYGKEDGVASDNDLYKVPAMRHPEIAAKLELELQNPEWDLIAVNFPGADMIGHLVTGQFDACKQTVMSLERALQQVVPVAQKNGWVLVLSADHGNIEHFGPDHGNNDVLTTLVIPEGSGMSVQIPPNRSARLFDISWTIISVLGATLEELKAPPFDPLTVSDPNRLVGMPLVK